EKAEKDKQDKEKAEKDKQDKGKAEKDKQDKGKAEKDKQERNAGGMLESQLNEMLGFITKTNNLLDSFKKSYDNLQEIEVALSKLKVRIHYFVVFYYRVFL